MACRKTSCIYHTGRSSQFGCNYIFVTGQSKTGQMAKGEKYDISNCKFYESGKKRSAVKQSYVTNTSEEILEQVLTVDRDAIVELFNQELCDADIAMLLEVSPKAIVKIRRQKGMLRTDERGGKLRRIDWDEVEKMIDEGYSDIAIALYMKIPLEVEQRYKKLLEKEKAEGGE